MRVCSFDITHMKSDKRNAYHWDGIACHSERDRLGDTPFAFRSAATPRAQTDLIVGARREYARGHRQEPQVGEDIGVRIEATFGEV